MINLYSLYKIVKEKKYAQKLICQPNKLEFFYELIIIKNIQKFNSFFVVYLYLFLGLLLLLYYSVFQSYYHYQHYYHYYHDFHYQHY